MEHVKETEWYEYAVGKCSSRRADWIEAHLEQCPECRSRMSEFRALDNLLDRWQVDTSRHEIAEKVVNAVSRPLKLEIKPTRPLRRRLTAWAAQIAAAVLIGAGLGHLAGRFSADAHIAQQQETAAQVRPSYLAALDLQFASDLTWSVLEEEQPAQEVEE